MCCIDELNPPPIADIIESLVPDCSYEPHALVAVDASCEGSCEPLTLVELIRFALGTLTLSRL